MTIRHLKVFQALCDHQYHMTRTAEALHMTQPAVSQYLHELEEHYGVQLFDRIGRKLVITQAGKRLLEYTVSLLSVYEDMEEGMQHWNESGNIRIGASLTIGPKFLPAYVRRYNRLHPESEVQIMVAPSDELEHLILENGLDLALIEGNLSSQQLIEEPYMNDELAVIASPDAGFRMGEKIPFSVFRMQKLLLRETGSGTRRVFDEAVSRAGFTAHPVWEAASTETLIEGAAAGFGLAVIPARLAEDAIAAGRIVRLYVEGLELERKFRIIRHRDKHLTELMRDFMRLIRESPEETGPIG